jgi:hypothetical protein
LKAKATKSVTKQNRKKPEIWNSGFNLFY